MTDKLVIALTIIAFAGFILFALVGTPLMPKADSYIGKSDKLRPLTYQSPCGAA